MRGGGTLSRRPPQSKPCVQPDCLDDVEGLSVSLPNETKSSTRGPFLHRSMRIGCVVFLVAYAVTATSNTKIAEYYDVDAHGNVVNPSQQSHMIGISLPVPQQQQRRQQQGRGDRRSKTVDTNASPEAQELQLSRKQQLKHIEGDTVEDQCGLYLAPSTIPGSGLGMFTTRPKEIGDTIGDSEVVIPLIELRFYNGDKDPLFNPFIHYYWRGREKGLHSLVPEQRSDEVQAIIPGLDAAINCNIALINVDTCDVVYNDSGLHRWKDAMAGAMTPYHSLPSKAVREIPAGSELFKFYGDRW